MKQSPGAWPIGWYLVPDTSTIADPIQNIRMGNPEQPCATAQPMHEHEIVPVVQQGWGLHHTVMLAQLSQQLFLSRRSSGLLMLVCKDHARFDCEA